MVGFLILLFVMVAIWGLLLGAADVSQISKNWEKYRCEPTVMPFASYFGHDINENFQFCLKNIMDSNISPVFSPLYTILNTFLGSMGNLVQVANNMRLEFATFLGGMNTLIQNFADRFVQLTTNVKVTAMRMKMLFGRVYAMFFAVIYMAMSGIVAMQNFGDTFLFRFLDTFCFAPETLVEIQGKGLIQVKDVKIGDVFEKTGSKVTATFQFESDGQSMVELPGNILVSTNHYMEYNGSHLKAVDHPLAKPSADWSGGSQRPLICFNTSDHRLPVGNFVFMDYDETETADHATMAWIDAKLNGKKPETNKTYTFDYTTAFDANVSICVKTHSKTIQAKDITLGTQLTTGRVIGIVQKEVHEICRLPTGEIVTPGSSLWDAATNEWKRAGELYSKEVLPMPLTFLNFVVKSSASIEFASGSMMRDYVEIHSPDAEQFYAKAIEASS